MSHTPRAPRALTQRRAIGRRLRAYRIALGLTIQQAKDAIGTGKAQLQAIETGNADVMASTLIDVAEVYGLNVALVAEYHLPLLNLTADELDALADLARRLTADAGWISPVLRSALDKLTGSADA